MKLKTVEIDGKTYAVVEDGKPVYTHEDGKDVAFDAVGTRDTITRLNGEAKNHREGKEAAETKLKAFDGLDATAARDAIDKLSRIDAKKLVEAGDMDAAIQAAIKPYAEKLTAAETSNTELTSRLNKSVIGNQFTQSKYASEKLTPAGVDLIRSIYGDRIKVEGDAIYGVDVHGAKLLSRSRHGEPANFDEMLEAFVDAYPHKDHILKSQMGGGGGAGQGGGGGSGKTMKTAEFNALSPKDRAAKMAEGTVLVD